MLSLYTVEYNNWRAGDKFGRFRFPPLLFHLVFRITFPSKSHQNPTKKTTRQARQLHWLSSSQFTMKFALLLDLTLSCILLWQVQAGSKSKKTKAKFCKDCYVYNGLKSSCHSCANCLFYHYDETCRPGKPLKGDDDKIGCGCNECNADVLHSYADGFT